MTENFTYFIFIIISIALLIYFITNVYYEKRKKEIEKKRKWIISYRYFYKKEKDEEFSKGFGNMTWFTYKELVDITLTQKHIEDKIKNEQSNMVELNIIYTSISEIKNV